MTSGDPFSASTPLGVTARLRQHLLTATSRRARSGWMGNNLRLLLLLVVAACGTGCATVLSHDAIRSFQQQQSCPANRLQVKHAVVRPQDLFDRGQPPAEVAADSGRLAVWNESFDRRLEDLQHLTAVDVTGCGAHGTYFCWSDNRGESALNEYCEPVDLDVPHVLFKGFWLKPSAGQWVRQQLGIPTDSH
jgi:hypothetical protein